MVFDMGLTHLGSEAYNWSLAKKKVSITITVPTPDEHYNSRFLTLKNPKNKIKTF